MPNFVSFLHGNNLSLIELQITKIVCLLLSEGELCVLGITDSSRFSCFISFKKKSELSFRFYKSASCFTGKLI